MPDDELVTIYETSDLVNATLYRDLLADAGIEVAEFGDEETIAYHMCTADSPFPYRLVVNGQDADTARALIADYQRAVTQGELTLPDEG